MTDGNFENNLCQQALSKVNMFLKMIGLSLNFENDQWGFKKLFYRKLFCLQFLNLFLVTISQFFWIVNESLNETLLLVELTYVGPCTFFCLLGCIKSYFFINYTPKVKEMVEVINVLYSVPLNLKSSLKKEINRYMQSHVNFLNRTLNILTALDGLGIIAFSAGPILITISQYSATSNLNLLLPFLLLYPFNPYNMYVWPFAYIHQMWSAVSAVLTVLGPDSLFHTSCVLLSVIFFQLKQEMQTIFDQKLSSEGEPADIRSKLFNLINRHKLLLSAVDLIDSIYSKSTLCNILTSSLLICFTGFNVMAYDSILIITPFISFLLMVTGQIFLLCYYGDLIQKSSAEISDAVYNCTWYEQKGPIMKNLLIISARSQKPCKFTAFGYAEINIQTFTKIMSTAWSYFAVLLSFHRNS